MSMSMDMGQNMNVIDTNPVGDPIAAVLSCYYTTDLSQADLPAVESDEVES